jgi:hypothetical protein
MKPKQFCILDSVSEIQPNFDPIPGVFSLIQLGSQFQLHWTSIKQSSITAIFQSSHDYSKDDWCFGGEFCVFCSDLQMLSLSENPLCFSLTRADRQTRTFSLTGVRFCEIVSFIELLLFKGMAVPTSDLPYSFEFYGNARATTYGRVYPEARVCVLEFETLEVFWKSVLDLSEALILFLDSEKLIPRDHLYPMGAVARASNQRRLEAIQRSASGDHGGQICESEWNGLFDNEGRLRDPERFRERLFFEGIESRLLVRALPFILSVFPWDSTEKERRVLKAELAREYEIFEKQCQGYLPCQMAANKNRAASFRVIKHDVERTDRSEVAFSHNDSTGLKMVDRILKCFCVYDPTVGYLQGMNDLLVPILLTYFPKWNEESRPIDGNGDLIGDWETRLPEMFWALDGLFRKVNHTSLLRDVNAQVLRIALQVERVVRRLSPLACLWLHRYRLMHMQWALADFIILFKRSVPDVWPIWVQINASPDPCNWPTLMMGALLILTFDQISRFPDPSMSVIMEEFPRMIQAIDQKTLARFTHFIFETMKTDDEFKRDMISPAGSDVNVESPCEWFGAA